MTEDAYPTRPEGPPPTARRRRAPRALVLGIVAVAAAGVAAVLVVVPSPSGPRSPEDVTASYYDAVRKVDAGAAYALICFRQQHGLDAFRSSVTADEQTGTGIRSWTRTAKAEVHEDLAAVRGRLVLDDGTTTPIAVLLVREDGAWKVCTSNLGGILPGPGTGTAGGGTQT